MGKIIGFSDKKKQEILKQANTFWDESTDKMSAQFRLVDERERLARGKLPQDLENAYATFKDRSALVPPDIYNNLNSLRAHMRRALFSKKPFLKLSHPQDPLLRDERIQKAELVLQQMNDKAADGAGLAMNGDLIIYQALYAGLTATFTQWVRQVARKVVRGGDGTMATDKDGAPIFRDEVVAQYAEDIPLDIRRVRWNSTAAEVKDIRTVGYHSIMTKKELIDRNRITGNHYQFSEKELMRSSFQKEKFTEFGPFNPDFTQSDDTKDICEVQHIRGLFRFEDSSGSITYEDLILEIGNRTLILALKKNDLPIPGWQLFKFPSIQREIGRMWPMGIIEPVLDTFVEQFVKRNQSLDGTNRNIYVKYVADSSAAQDLPEYVEHGDDQIMLLNVAGAGLASIQDAITFLPRPNTSQDSFNQAAALSRETQQTMRMSDFLQGKDPGRQETATGASLLVAGGQNLTTHLIESLADTWLRPTSKLKLILWNFFMGDVESNVTAPGGEIFNIAPGELDLPYNVSIETSLAATQPSAQRRMVEAFPVIANDPMYDGLEVRRTFNEVLDLPNQERLLINPTKLERTITNESIALGFGVPQQVDPNDNHTAHRKNHLEYLQFILQQQERTDVGPEESTQISELRTDVLEEHIEEHDAALEQQQQAIGNTKELGGNTGNLVQPDGASQNVRTQGGQGNFTPRENR